MTIEELKISNKKYQDELDYYNSIRTKEYNELKELMLQYCGFTNLNTRKENCYIDLWAINNFIEDFECKVIQSVGNKKIVAENHLKMLYNIQQQYGKFYFESIIYREKVVALEKERIFFSRKIEELQIENNKLTQQLNF